MTNAERRPAPANSDVSTRVPTNTEELANASWSGTRRHLVITAAGTATMAATGISERTSAQESATPAPATPSAATPGSGTPVAGIIIPSTPAGNQLTWFIETFNAVGEGAELTVADVEERFSAVFLESVPADGLISLIAELAAELVPVSLAGFVGEPTELSLIAVLDTATGTPWELSLVTESDAPFRIDGLLYQAVRSLGQPLAGWDELGATIGGLAAQVSFYAVEITPDGALPIHANGEDQRLAIGSAFKLYVLGELARQVQTGDADWDEKLAIQDELKSLPSGILQDAPAGTELTLREHAELMISISDNTATDHLIDRLGRENVEGIQSDFGHGDPGANIPFLTTRELFSLKLAGSEELIDQYVEADIEGRRDILETEVSTLEPSLDDAFAWVEPRDIDTLEWFASSQELVNAMQSLTLQAEQPGLEPILDVLAINPGAEFENEQLPYVGYKGGSEPGVLALAWLIERKDGRRFAVALSANDPDNVIDEFAAVDLGRRAVNLATTS